MANDSQADLMWKTLLGFGRWMGFGLMNKQQAWVDGPVANMCRQTCIWISNLCNQGAYYAAEVYTHHTAMSKLLE